MTIRELKPEREAELRRGNVEEDESPRLTEALDGVVVLRARLSEALALLLRLVEHHENDVDFCGQPSEEACLLSLQVREFLERPR
jgi:hypothetical protein